jgi:hypothetical protein
MSWGDGIPRSNIVDRPDPLDRQQDFLPVKVLRLMLRWVSMLWRQQRKPEHAQVFGLWRDRPECSLALQQTLRQEWVEG